MNVWRIRTKLAAFAFICASPVMGGSIEGRVTNSVTGEPIVGAKVRFLDRRSHVYTTTSDARGEYRLSGLDDGEYRGEFSMEGFSDYRQGSNPQDVLNGGLRVSGDLPARTDAQLQPWGRLRGRVIDEDGKPAAGVTVVLIPRGREGITMTEERGEFTFEQLRPGSYTLVAKPESRTRMRDGEKVGDVPVYYPSETRQVDAAAISISWGQNVTGIEIRLKRVPVHRLAGVALDATGKPAAHATVTLMGRTYSSRQLLIFGGTVAPGMPLHYVSAPGREPDLAVVESREDGTFEFPAVESGEWRLRAEIDPDERPRIGVAAAFVGGKDVEDVQIRMSTPFNVEVTTDWGDAEPPKPKNGDATRSPALIRLLAEEGPPLTFDSSGQATSINGAFPGRYRVLSLNAADGLYPGAVMFGGRDVLGQTIDLTPGVGPLHVIVGRDGGTVRGRVDNGNGATAFLIPQAPGEMIDYMSVQCGAGGAFEFRNIVPGNYYVVAFDHGGQLPPTDLPDSIATIATEVRVEPGASGLPLNVRFNKWQW